jgi:small-conductance mechanosensitive channel
MNAQHAVNIALYEQFKKEGIEIAYPTRVIYTKNK